MEKKFDETTKENSLDFDVTEELLLKAFTQDDSFNLNFMDCNPMETIKTTKNRQKAYSEEISSVQLDYITNSPRINSNKTKERNCVMLSGKIVCLIL